MHDIHLPAAQPGEAALCAVRERLYAFCFPNAPRTAQEREAFEQAALLQYAHEETARRTLGDVPEGAQAFRIGEFQMNLDSRAATGRLTVRSVCPAAYGLLLRSGLLYRGAEGRC